MGLLLYKSDEMYSSTELIRKSKMIFDKVLDKKIDKAIILRDGKPSFLLMEFKKYEKIMEEYEELKNYVESLKTINPSKIVKKDKQVKKNDYFYLIFLSKRYNFMETYQPDVISDTRPRLVSF